MDTIIADFVGIPSKRSPQGGGYLCWCYYCLSQQYGHQRCLAGHLEAGSRFGHADGLVFGIFGAKVEQPGR